MSTKGANVRLLAALTVLCCAMVATPTVAQAGDCPGQTVEPVVLCLRNFIRVSQPGSVRVVISETAELVPEQYFNGIDPKWGSPFEGVVIKEDGPQGRYALAASQGGPHGGSYNDTTFGSFPEPHGYPVLPPGEYTLYFVTKPGPRSNFEFRMFGLSGSLDLAPTTPAVVDFRELANEIQAGPVSDRGVTFSAGTEFVFPDDRPSFAWFSASWRGLGVANLENLCIYDSAPEGDYAYWPGCMTDNEASSFGLILGPEVAVAGGRMAVFFPGYVRLPWTTSEPPKPDTNAAGIWRATGGTFLQSSALGWQLFL